ncbi:MAG: PKD domain-containing protein [Bacteroidetes bacterium]|nr:PKD domain-containing protein [Bacteroidota bacterium]
MKTELTHLLRRAILCLLVYVAALQTARSQVHADFSTSPLNGCAPLFVSFHDQSTGNPVAWKWDLGNGTVSYLQNPSATYFNPGKYTIKLVVRNAANKADSVIKTNYVTVNALPKPLFKVSDTTGCYPLSIQFTDQSIAQEGTIVKWEWDLGDGTVSSAQNPQHIYTAPGFYNVTLRVTNSTGCVTTLSKQQYIKINDGVKASFNFNNTNLCKPPSLVNFTNTSTGTGTLNYQWSFGDGNTSTFINPANTYLLSGQYSAKLIVTNDKGCTDTMLQKNAVLVGLARASFTAPDSVCQAVFFNLKNTTNPAAAGYLWQFSDGSSATDTDPAKKFDNAGTGTIRLIADFGSCHDTAVKNIKVVGKPVMGFTADKTASCKTPFTVQFSNTGTGGKTYQWLFGDGGSSTQQNPSHTYQQPGDYTVTLIATNSTGCPDTLSVQHYIVIRPVDIQLKGIPYKGCLPVSYSPNYIINSVVPIASYHWDFGDGGTSAAALPTHVYTSQGIYTVQLTYTTAEGCTGTFSWPNAVLAGQKPKASFTSTPPDACASTPIQFTDHTTGNATSWLWLFGDGAADTVQHPAHLYNDTGYFSVKLIASNYGCSDTVVVPNTVHINAPIARIGVNADCRTPYNYGFRNYSIGATSWTWDFGDGQSTQVENPSHVFAAPGYYNIRLTVTNGTCTHTTVYPARIIDEKADFTASATSVCRGDTIQLTPMGFNKGNVQSYRWNVATRTDTAGAGIHVSFPQTGAYTVQFILYDINGCADTMTKVNYLHVNGPLAAFNPAGNNACLNQGGNIFFNDASSTDGTNAITRWQWNFGDSSSKSYTAGPFSHIYTKAGTYTVQLKVTDASGCSDSISQSNTINIGDPKAGFSSPDTTGCNNSNIHFVNTSRGMGLSYTWDMGDGLKDYNSAPVHNYTQSGDYSVELKIQDSYGCRDSMRIAKYIHVDQPRSLYRLSDSTGTCPPLVVKFTNQSTYYTGTSWDFGDGTGAQVENPVHYYNYPGIYYARLVVTSPGGCTDTLAHKIDIKGPTGTFSYDKTVACTPGTVNFTAQTANASSLIWDFNDGNTMQTPNTTVSHSFAALGIYVPKMILEDAQGCKVPIVGKDTISIYGVTSVFGSDRKLICDAGNVIFTDSSSSNDLITGYEWHFGDGTVSYDPAPVHAYTVTGVYPVQLIVTTSNGCTSTSVQSTNIKVAASPQVSIRGDSSACEPATLNLFGAVVVPDTSALSWQWHYANGGSATGQNPAPVTYPVAGTYPVSIDVTNSSGCVSTVSKPLVIHPKPKVDAGNDVLMCEKKPAMLKATGADTYTWGPAVSLSCNNCATTLASPDSNTLYHLHGETVFGCKGDDSVLVRVKHPFRMNVGGGDTLCKGEAFRLSARNAELYDWTPATGLDNSHAGSPLAKPGASTDYRVIGYDSAGCFYDTGYVKVTVFEFPTVDAGADITLPVGNSTKIDLKLSNDVTHIQWQPATGLSCATCASVSANPKQTTAYQITVTNQGGCVNKDQLTVYVVCNEGNVFMPNTFSPNGDGTNDVFYPRGRGLYNIRSMRIFNRWGEPVYEVANFQANDASKGWNGQFKNNPAPNDVYVYFVEVVCENNAILTYSGNIALIR